MLHNHRFRYIAPIFLFFILGFSNTSLSQTRNPFQTITFPSEDDIQITALAFAPGEYFDGSGKDKNYITGFAKKIKSPVFITSAKDEKENWQPIYDAIPSSKKQFFLPESNGNHGSKALWEKFEDSIYYWESVTKFLDLYSK